MRSNKFFQAEQAALVWDAPGLVAGVDEAGRGPLAGPVVAAAVILDERKPIRGLADSKQLTAKRREKLYDEIRAKGGLPGNTVTPSASYKALANAASSSCQPTGTPAQR